MSTFDKEARMAAIKKAQDLPFDPAFDSDADEMLRWGSLNDLSTAALEGSDHISALTSSCTSLDAGNDRHWSALHIAAQYGRLNAVKALLAAGANVDGGSCRGPVGGITPLFLALAAGHIDVAKELLAAVPAPDVNSPYDANGTSILRLAILHSDVEGKLVNTVLDLGADASIQDYCDRCVLFGILYAPVLQLDRAIDTVINPLFAAGLVVDKETADDVRTSNLPTVVAEALLESSKSSVSSSSNELQKDALPALHNAVADNDYDDIEKLVNPENVNSVCWVSPDAFFLWTGFNLTKANAITALSSQKPEDGYYLTPLQIAGIKNNQKVIEMLKAAGAKEGVNPNADSGITLKALSAL